jgi:hypothetical protein
MNALRGVLSDWCRLFDRCGSDEEYKRLEHVFAYAVAFVWE